jgi:NitT/TauT family transport system substrate-binding protein
MGYFASRRRFLTLLALGSAGSLLAACSPAPTPAAPATTVPAQAKPTLPVVSATSVPATSAPAVAPTSSPATKMRILINPGSNSHIPIYVGSDAGIFQKHNLDVDILVNADAIKPMLSGDADVGFPSPTLTVSAAQQGFKVKIFMTLIDRILQSVMVRNDFQTTVPAGKWPDVMTDLKGKTIGVTVRGGAVDLNMRYLLQQAGLDPEKDVEIVPAGGAAQLLAAMQGDRVDAVMAIQPLTAVLVDSGKAKIILDLSKGEGPSTMNQPFIAGAATDAFIQANSDAMQRLVQALQETSTYIQNPANKSAMSDLVLNRVYPSLTPSQITQVIDQLSSTTQNVCFGGSNLGNIAAVLKAQEQLTRDVTAQDMIYFPAQVQAGCPGS